ncbi:hypothetical protein [Entomospira culicis]|uniref:Uncharacterized protein n=1 Tax=Entomospira culicis TaxID=2719989 RepID=A0A968GHH7_9SPIO|nr:hypothetical protein [Entomospira culicis]NIZ18907.1 hypothetical protein [Entomospira culicis]NIZ69122.1 hypothetical protein [Entomospira culicis]WDI37708.1 hypothetical protein PVA46_02690 [Entomospira culicis]WDI39336.1 hypothetical protein PVA47_02695 [Entomospira culicis]
MMSRFGAMLLWLFFVPMLWANDRYIVAVGAQEITIFSQSGERIMRIQPHFSRILRTQYQNGRPAHERLEQRNLAPFPWFFAPDGGFFSFSTTRSLTYYNNLEEANEYQVLFYPQDILQVISQELLLIRYKNRPALWQRSTNTIEELPFNLPDLHELAMREIIYSPSQQLLASTHMERLDYYTNPALGTIASQRAYTIQLQSRGTQPIVIPAGAHIYYDQVSEHIYFFFEKRLHHISLLDKKITSTNIVFNNILTSVAGAWRTPAVLPMGNDQYLIWHHMPYAQASTAQLALYDGKSGDLLQQWPVAGEQGELFFIKELP